MHEKRRLYHKNQTELLFFNEIFTHLNNLVIGIDPKIMEYFPKFFRFSFNDGYP